MITLTTEQAQQIEEALDELRYANNTDIAKTKYYKALSTIRAARALEQTEPKCNPHQDAPHGFDRNASHSANRYVCECEGWEPEPAEQPVSQEYQDHLVNQSFDWAAMAAKHQFMEGYRIGLAEMREKCAVICEAKQSYSAMHANTEFAAVIRAIKFEGDTGFRPVSEMIAEHKQDPKKAAAIEKAKMRKAEQEPEHSTHYWQNEVNQARSDGYTRGYAAGKAEQAEKEPVCKRCNGTKIIPDGKMYSVDGFQLEVPIECVKDCPDCAAPIHTKDLTPDELFSIANKFGFDGELMKTNHDSGMPSIAEQYASAVIAAYKEKNRGD